MFKRTNKLWKGLALVLALCMISTVAYASGDSQSATITLSDGCGYEAATKTVTIAGTIGVPGNDVTILALRSGATYDELTDVWTEEEMLLEKVIYIDQEASDETTGEFSFSFVPRAGVKGGCITVFVGGEDVAAVKVWSTSDGGETAPTLDPEIDVWYEGVTELTFNLMSGDEPFENADDWGSIIETVTVFDGDETRVVAHSYDAVEDKLTLSGFDTTGESITKIEITTEDNAYAKAVWTGELAQERKDLGGNVLSASGSVVAPGNAAITVRTDDTAWKSNLSSSVYVHGEIADVDWNEVESILYVPVDISDKAELEELVTITVDQDYYEDETVNVTVIAPTKNQLTEDANIAAITVDYSETEEDEDAEANMGDEVLSAENKDTWGQASITLPAAPSEEFHYVWTIACEDEAAVLPDDADTGLTGEVVLDRPAYGSDKGAFEYTLTLTIEDAAGVYAEAEKEFTLRVNEVGVVGVEVEVTPKFSNNDVVNVRVMEMEALPTTIVLKNESTTIPFIYGSGVFTATGVPDGTYDLIIRRGGFLAAKVEVTIEGESPVISMPNMIAGDVDGSGEVGFDDLTAFARAYGKTSGVGTGYNANCDFDANSTIEFDDLTAFARGYSKTSNVEAE